MIKECKFIDAPFIGYEVYITMLHDHSKNPEQKGRGERRRFLLIFFYISSCKEKYIS